MIDFIPFEFVFYRASFSRAHACICLVLLYIFCYSILFLLFISLTSFQFQFHSIQFNFLYNISSLTCCVYPSLSSSLFLSLALSVCLSPCLFVGFGLVCLTVRHCIISSSSWNLLLLLLLLLLSSATLCVRFASSSSFLISFNLQCQQRLTFDCKTTATTTATIVVFSFQILSVGLACLPACLLSVFLCCCCSLSLFSDNCQLTVQLIKWPNWQHMLPSLASSLPASLSLCSYVPWPYPTQQPQQPHGLLSSWVFPAVK